MIMTVKQVFKRLAARPHSFWGLIKVYIHILTWPCSQVWCNSGCTGATLWLLKRMLRMRETFRSGEVRGGDEEIYY